MTPVFLDTVRILALWDDADQWHGSARLAYESVEPARFYFVTTSFVLLECANHASRKSYRGEVSRLRHDLDAAGDIYEPTAAEVDAAWAEYGRRSPGAPGVVDLVSFSVMRRIGATKVLTSDRHFNAAGFEILMRPK